VRHGDTEIGASGGHKRITIKLVDLHRTRQKLQAIESDAPAQVAEKYFAMELLGQDLFYFWFCPVHV